jgi:hypothetical protein
MKYEVRWWDFWGLWIIGLSALGEAGMTFGKFGRFTNGPNELLNVMLGLLCIVPLLFTFQLFAIISEWRWIQQQIARTQFLYEKLDSRSGGLTS